MATKYIRSTVNKTAYLSGDNSRWELSYGRYVKNTTPFSDVGIEIRDGADNLGFSIKGKILMTGTQGHSGIDVLGENDRVSIASTGWIKSDGSGVRLGINTAGEFSEINRATLAVNGRIEAGVTGIFAAAEENVISVGTLGHVVANGAAISGTVGTPGALLSVTNLGEIATKTAGNPAIHAGDMTLHLINKGTITGNVIGSIGADRFDLRSGTIDGVVNGQFGDDTYLVSSQAMADKISETGVGTDLIRANANLDITNLIAVENIALFGKMGLTATGNTLDNMIWGTSFNDHLLGANGNDTLEGGNGDDTLDGGWGDDSMRGGDGNDDMIGGLGDDTMTGSRGEDTLSGGDNNDTLNGGDGKDQLDGGAGQDTLYTSAGGDDIRGGLAADTFIFRVGFNGTTIKDFENGVDKFDVGELDFGVNDGMATESFAQLVIVDITPGLADIGCKVTFGTETFFLDGINKNQIDVSDFTF